MKEKAIDLATGNGSVCVCACVRYVYHAMGHKSDVGLACVLTLAV